MVGAVWLNSHQWRIQHRVTPVTTTTLYSLLRRLHVNALLVSLVGSCVGSCTIWWLKKIWYTGTIRCLTNYRFEKCSHRPIPTHCFVFLREEKKLHTCFPHDLFKVVHNRTAVGALCMQLLKLLHWVVIGACTKFMCDFLIRGLDLTVIPEALMTFSKLFCV